MMKVGIALATYNPNLQFLQEQIDSLRNQSFSNWCCVVSDDSTSTESALAIQVMVAQDLRFHYVKNNGRKGVFRNFENALKTLDSDCNYFCFCDQDDIWENHKIAQMISALEQNPKAMLAHSDLSLIDEKGAMVASSCWKIEKRNQSSELDLLHLAIRNNVTGCALMFRRSLLSVALPFPETSNEEPYLHDHWLAMVALSMGEVLGIEKPLIRYRQHGSNVIGAQKKSTLFNLKNFKKILDWKLRSLKVLNIRQKLALDLISRIQCFDGLRARDIDVNLMPLMKPSALFFFKGLITNFSQAPMWSGLFIASLIFKSKDESFGQSSDRIL